MFYQPWKMANNYINFDNELEKNQYEFREAVVQKYGNKYGNILNLTRTN